MKTLNILNISFLFLLISNISYGQNWTEDFETQTSGSYGSTTITISGRDWTRKDAGNFGYALQKTGSRGFTINDDRSNAHITTPLLNTCGTVSFKYAYTSGSSSNVFQLQVSTDGINFSTLDTRTLGASANENYTDYSFNVNNLSSTVFIRILSDDQNAHLFIDDFSVTDFSGSTPGISLGTVSGNTNESGTTATFTTVLNSAPTSDVFINVTSGDTGEVTVSPSILTFTSINWDQAQIVTATGVDDSSNDDNVDVVITLAVDISSDDDYDGISTTTTVINEDDDLPQIIISEIMYNSSGTDDEWIELYNGNGDDVDISSWTIAYSGGTFTFPGSTTITNGDYITIALGSNGDGSYNNDNPFTPDFNNLSGSPSNSNVKDTIDTDNLGNTSGTITLKNGSGTSIDIVDYDDGDASSTDGSGPSYEIIDTTVDNSTTASNWQASVFNGGTPGFVETSWIGTTSSDWADVTNWSTGALPTSSDIVIVDGTFTNEPAIASTDAAVNSLFVATGNTLAIDETSSLTVSGDFTNDGTVTLNSTADDFSSLIVTGTASGDITYNRFVNSYNDGFGGGWDLVGAPAGMTISDFITANGAAGSNVIKVLGDDYAFSQYDNALGQWDRYQTASQTGSFTTGQGYSMATNAGDGATVAFTGTMQTTTQSIDIINNNGLNNVGRRWNLVSNPFPSFINGNTAAGTTNFLGANSTIMDGTFTGVYGWNGSSYTIYNLLDAAFSIAPGQAFWVAALNTTNTALNFTADMRTTTGTGDFVTGPQLLTYSVGLKLFNGETQKAATKLYFRDGLSLDLDPGYDAGAFNQSTKLSTRLPGGSQETAFARNAMGMDAMQNTRVPLEIRQNAGQAFTISIADMELPQDIYVYLEDTLNGTLTSLKDQDFELTAQSDLSGLDRFFIVFKSNSVLSNGDTLGIEALNVYKANSDSFVTIAGISPKLGKLNVSLYNILGQTVREKTLNPTTATQTISTQGLASGLYIVQIKSGNQVFTKKIVVK
ncbi:lamin tail domain-containing protein [Flavobacteriaceae bacterium]|nr:lamin tail domain-containing protein [Flavobacteriaceae bacterium]MDC0097442.1 lamin tail domain-containing protein [Flavobacteriaceae bacterium]